MQPKYQLLQEWLKERIISGEYRENGQIPTEAELAEQFQYSRQTIRQAIRALENEGLVRRIRGRGTFVCRYQNERIAARTPGAGRIGVLTTYLDDYIFPGIINGIERVLTENGELLTLGLTHNKTQQEAAALRRLLDSGINGLIIEGTKSALSTPNKPIIQTFRDAGIPIVFINGFYDGGSDSYVVMDDVRSGEMVTQLLLDNGHRNIGGIFKSDDIQGIKRYQGMIRGMQNNGLNISDDGILWYTTEDIEYFFGGSMDEMVLNRLKDMSAVICYNDEIAVKLISMLNRAGMSVPKDISVVGFDNSPFAALPLYDLTTVTYPAQQIGETAAKVLLKSLEDPSYREYIKIEPELILRKSVMPKETQL